MASAIAVGAAAVLVWLAVWWATRAPRPRTDEVSQAWRDAYTRDRHD